MSAEMLLAPKFLLLFLSLFLFSFSFICFAAPLLAVFSQLAFIKHFCLYVLYAVYVPISGVFVWFYFYD